jgi:hypothetical protein
LKRLIFWRSHRFKPFNTTSVRLCGSNPSVDPNVANLDTGRCYKIVCQSPMVASSRLLWQQMMWVWIPLPRVQLWGKHSKCCYVSKLTSFPMFVSFVVRHKWHQKILKYNIFAEEFYVALKLLGFDDWIDHGVRLRKITFCKFEQWKLRNSINTYIHINLRLQL